MLENTNIQRLSEHWKTHKNVMMQSYKLQVFIKQHEDKNN